jgi:23S rRNA (adenine2503-C2)-methyltransferase
MSLEELREWLWGRRERPARTGQIFAGLNREGARSLDEIAGLSRRAVERLGPQVSLRTLVHEDTLRDADGTMKLLFRDLDGARVESVLFPMTSDYSLCLSSQFACRLGCAFCRTGQLPALATNLSAGAILDQYRDAVRLLGGAEAITNLVFMGMGEPLLNYARVIKAIGVLTAEDGPQLSTRRITVSTAGVAPLIPRLGHDTGVNLAVSLTAANDALRDRLMPINRRWPLATLKKALEDFPLSSRRRMTIEVVMLAGVNDSDAHAREIADFLSGLRAKVNLIPFNEHHGARFEASSPARAWDFGAVLRARGFSVQIRQRRGADVGAACGQLGPEPVARALTSGSKTLESPTDDGVAGEPQ